MGGGKPKGVVECHGHRKGTKAIKQNIAGRQVLFPSHMYIQKLSSRRAPEGRGAFLALPAELEAVLSEPRGPPGAALGLVVLVALAQAAGALACMGKASE